MKLLLLVFVVSSAAALETYTETRDITDSAGTTFSCLYTIVYDATRKVVYRRQSSVKCDPDTNGKQTTEEIIIAEAGMSVAVTYRPRKGKTWIKKMAVSEWLKYLVEGDFVQSSPPPSNDWHYVTIRAQNGSENLFTWKNRAGVEWDLILVEEESSGVFKFQVGENCPYNTEEHGYAEARLFTNNTIEIEGPHGTYTKQTSGEMMSLSATCDDVMTVYFDGEATHFTSSNWNWGATSFYSIPAGTKVLAISCLNLGGAYGILASISTGVSTSAHWSCSNTWIDGWTRPDFGFPQNSYPFPNAKSLGHNGVGPWGTRPGIQIGATWIWSQSGTSWAGCRINIG